MAVVLKGERTTAHPSNRVRRTFHFPSSFGLTLPAQQKVFFGGGGGESVGANKRELLQKRLEKPIYHCHCLFFTSLPTFGARSHHSLLKPPATELYSKVWITNSNEDFQIERTLRNQFCILATTLRGVLSTGERTFLEASIMEQAICATFSAWLSQGLGSPPTTM